MASSISPSFSSLLPPSSNPKSSPSSLPHLHARFPRLPLRKLTVSMSKPPSADIGEKLSKSIEEAQEVCAAEGASKECAAAWDEVEELSSTVADQRIAAKSATKDPLEQYCKDEPQADECRVYED